MFIDFLSASSSSLTDNTATVYYVIGIIVIVVGAVAGGFRLYQKQRKKWTDEGISSARQAVVVEENSRVMRENTEAIIKLSLQFTEFMGKVTAELNGHAMRLGKLEHQHKDHENGTGT